ncbi:MAG: hypothetical protein HYZ88_01590 [Candidatus Omnitrophica bacterium]|nr:hypothetical protein [Candidatus Omnitrophota bacterium]
MDRAPQPAQEPSRSATPDQMSGSRPQPQRSTSSSQHADGEKSGAANKGAAQADQANSNAAAQQSGSTQTGANQAGRARANNRSQEPGTSEKGSTAPGQGTQPLSPAQQEQLSGEIRQLLKEMSGELKQLQAQLDAKQQDQPHPLPGTSTDPDLYDRSSTLDSRQGSQLPILFDADQQLTSSARRGGGVGEPSQRVAGATPQQPSEDATLADQADEETPIQRQAVPPEYRPVFERLSHGKDPQ